MKILLMLSVVLGAGYYFVFNISTSSFDDAGNPITVVFTQKNCGSWCDNGVKDLERRNIPFTELPIDNEKDNSDRYKAMGAKGLPLFVMGNQSLAGYGRHQLLNIVAQTFGDKYLTRREKKYYRNHFYNDASPLVYIYGASWCPYCKKLRKDLDARDIDYFELDVEKATDPRLIANTMGVSGYPVVFVGYVRVLNGPDLIGNVLDAVDIAGDRIL